MPELPKIVISKLAGRQVRPEASLPDAVHPDPDLLTAFVEQSLPERERTALLGHLADCAPCREILALAQPELVETQVVKAEARPRTRGWFLRWGVLAACAAVAISAVVLLRQPHETQFAAKQEAPGVKAPDASNAIGLDQRTDGKADAAKSSLPSDRANGKAALTPPVLGDAANTATLSAGQVAENGKVGEYQRHRAAVSAPGPSPMSNNAGYAANNAVSKLDTANPNSTTKTNDLPLNGRNVVPLIVFGPGVARGQGSQGGVGNGETQNEAQKTGAAPAVSYDMYGAGRVDSPPGSSRDKVLKAKKENSVRSEEAGAVGAASAAPVLGKALRAAAPASSPSASAPSPPVRQGEIRGQVVDPSGASVGGASVIVTNAATGARVTATADSAGTYGLTVPAGGYNIAVSKPGFKEFLRRDVQVGPSTVALTAKLEIGSTSETVEVTSQAVSTETESATVPYAPAGTSEIRASSGVMVVDGMISALPAGKWQVTDAGNLQRSLDGGKSWESVSVGPAVRLRVVAANGFQVWAGGNGGALFHSGDSGAHFAAVKIHRKHVAVTGDIVSLTFTDARHGRIETADHDVWTTTDGGKSWRQPAVK